MAEKLLTVSKKLSDQTLIKLHAAHSTVPPGAVFLKQWLQCTCRYGACSSQAGHFKITSYSTWHLKIISIT